MSVTTRLYYLDEEHEKLTTQYLKRFGLTSVYSDVEYGVFCYLIGASGKSELKKYCSEKGIKVKDLLENAVPHSTTEINFIKAGLHMFNDKFGQDLQINELFRSLDSKHRKVIYQAFQIRYGE